MAQTVRDQMESLLLKDAPRIADSFSNALREMEAKLDLAYAEVNKLERHHADLQRMHDALQERAANESQKHSDLKRAHAELATAHATDAKRVEELARAYDEIVQQHERDAARIKAVEEFLSKFPR